MSKKNPRHNQQKVSQKRQYLKILRFFWPMKINDVLMAAAIIVFCLLIMRVGEVIADAAIGALGLTTGWLYYRFGRRIDQFLGKNHKVGYLLSLILTVIISVFSGILIYTFIPKRLLPEIAVATENETLVLVANFEIMSSTNTINPIADIYLALRDLASVRVERIPDQIKIYDSRNARKIGKEVNASLVIWGHAIEQGITINYELISDIPISEQKLFSTSRSFNSFQFSKGIATFIPFVQRGLDAKYSVSYALGLTALARGNYSVAQNHLGEALDYLGDISNIEQGIKQLPLGATYYELGQAYYADNGETNFQLAIDSYTNALKYSLDPDLTYSILNARGISYADHSLAHESKHEYDNALEDFNNAIGINSQNSLAYFNLGLLYKTWNKPEEAVKAYFLALNRDLEFPSIIYNNLGNAYTDLQKYPQAIASFDHALEQVPDNDFRALVLYNKSYVYGILGYTDTEMSLLNTVISLDVTSSKAYYSRANSYQQLGDDISALSDYNRAISLNADLDPAYNNRANIYVNQKKFDEAIVDFTHAIMANSDQEKMNRIGKNDAATYYTGRGFAFYYKGDITQAEKDFRYAIKLKRDYRTYLGLGLVEQALSQDLQAIADFHRYIELSGRRVSLEIIIKSQSLEAKLGLSTSTPPAPTS
jgi:tetratricopeptide (TPR) repeat protein